MEYGHVPYDYAHMFQEDVPNSINGPRMINYWSISMLLVLLEPVNRAEFKYVFAV